MAPASPGWGELETSLPAPWASLLDATTIQAIRQIGRELQALSVAHQIVPPVEDVFRALDVSPDQVRVVIIGQDPYPTPGHAMGLSFSVPPGVTPLPPSARNIVTELESDIGVAHTHGFDLSPWVSQGVLLLNQHLTTTAHSPAAHEKLGWSAITEAIIRSLLPVNTSFVAIVWGNHAKKLSPLLKGIPLIESAHPSPLSAHRGFFGSKPFSRTNEELIRMGRRPINWSLG